jgi:hypothetical protein
MRWARGGVSCFAVRVLRFTEQAVRDTDTGQVHSLPPGASEAIRLGEHPEGAHPRVFLRVGTQAIREVHDPVGPLLV